MSNNTFTFAFSVIRNLKARKLCVEKIRMAVHSAVEEVRIKSDYERKATVKVGKKETKIRFSDIAKANAATTEPLKLAHLSQRMDELGELHLEPLEIELPKSLHEWTGQFVATPVMASEAEVPAALVNS